MAEQNPDREHRPDAGRRRPDVVTDVGRTMGGGSLGHAPADDVTDQADLRNNPPDASTDAGRVRAERDK